MDNLFKKTRVLLLNPPTAAVSREILLNLAYLAAFLRKNGHEVRIIDATAPYKPVCPDGIKKIIAEFKPNFIGVTLTITYIPQTYLFLKNLRKIGIPIVAGGPHANCQPEEVLENGVDIVAIGEGEETIFDLAEYFVGAKSLKDIAGLCFKDENGRIFYSSPRRLIEDLDSIPFPDFTDFPIKNYTGSEDVNSNPIFWSVFTSRGCPFDCIFCASHNVFGRTIRMRSARNIFEEIRELVDRFGLKKITFQDDEILCSRERFLELCDLILESGLKINMSIRTRIDSIDKEILLKAKSAGLTRISFGIESWNDDTLEKINKKYTVDDIHKKFKFIEETRFPYIAFNNICGFPWETKKHMQKNLNEISKINKSIRYFISLATPIPYPKTKLYNDLHQQFGFTDWWLDPKKNSAIDTNGKSPFFMNFSVNLPAFYNPNIYWNYSKEMQQFIRYFCWKALALSMRRHLKFYKYPIFILLFKLSYLLWKISPRVEIIVFRLFPASQIDKLKKELLFIHKN